jgi:hypothetical protein
MKRLVLIFFITAACSSLLAQHTMPSVVNATGGSFKKGNDIFEWSIGELALVDEMQSADKGVTITNGFFQTYSVPDKKDSVIKPSPGKSVIILPNPTKGKLRVNFAFNQPGRLKLIVCNEIGFKLYEKQLSISTALASEEINMERYSNGNYFLIVEMTSNNSRLKKRQTFKIVKIH